MEKRSVFHRVGLTVARNFLTVTVPLAVVVFIYNDRRPHDNDLLSVRLFGHTTVKYTCLKTHVFHKLDSAS